MIGNTEPKFQNEPLSPDKKEKMDLSFEESAHLDERDVKCPYCSSVITKVFSDAVGHLRVKCPKCKANMVLSLAYFRRRRGYGKYKERHP